MNTIKQVIRQPLKSFMGILMAAGACCALCICVAQFVAAMETQQQLKELFQPVGFPSSSYEKVADDWLFTYAEENPEIIQRIDSSGLVSAFIPNLNPDNYSQYCPPKRITSSGNSGDNLKYLPNMSRTQYNSAMLLIMLEEVGEPTYQSYEYITGSTEYGLAKTQRMIIKLKGTVEAVVGMEQGYNDPVGYTADLTLCVSDQAELETLHLVPGEKYLVYGTDYIDADYNLRCYFALKESADGTPYPFIPAFDSERLHMYTPEEIENMSSGLPESQVVVGYYEYDEGTVAITRSLAQQLKTITLTLWDQSSMPHYTYETDTMGRAIEVAHPDRSFRNQSGEMVTMGVEEYSSIYREPTIARIDTTVEEFLNSEEGVIWGDALRNVEINAHAFPVVGVKDIDYIADFYYGAARILKGRGFSQQEIDYGAKVCVISEKLAAINGLSVGDSISLQTYQNDPGVPYQTDISSGNGASSPMACYFFGTTMSLNPVEEYTIVGIYQQDNAWGNYSDNFYAFTPNTIFVPGQTIADIAEYSYTGLFRTVQINGEYLDRFLEDIGIAGYSGQLLVEDNGYSAAAEGVANYQQIAQTAMIVSAAVFVIILALFMLLFPGSVGKTLFTMQCLGANRKERICYVMEYALSITLPGTLMGALMGEICWGYMSAVWQYSSNMDSALLIPNVNCFAIGVLHFLTFVVFSAITAFLTSRDQGIQKKGGI